MVDKRLKLQPKTINMLCPLGSTVDTFLLVTSQSFAISGKVLLCPANTLVGNRHTVAGIIFHRCNAVDVST